MNNTKNFLLDRYKFLYIMISSIILYTAIQYISFERSVYVSLIIRTYYAIASTVIIIILKQIKNYNDEYIYDIIWKFLSMIIIISMLYFILNSKIDMKSYSNIYVEVSSELILLYGTLLIYVVSKYLLKKIQNEKVFYVSVIITIIVVLSTIYLKGYSVIIRIIIMLIQVIFLTKIMKNIYEAERVLNKCSNMLKCYTIFVAMIQVGNIYGSVLMNSQKIMIFTEIIHLINFKILYNILITNFVREPYRNLSKSLAKENIELDKLNFEVILKNYELENSINTLKEKDEFINRLVKFMPHPIIMLNEKNDRIVFINKKLSQLVGLNTAKKLVNKKIDKYVEFINRFDEEYEYNAVIKINGIKKYVLTKQMSCHLDEHYKIIVIKDNTAKVESNELRREIKKKQHEEKMRSQFLSSISHDLKTPINVIYSASQVEKIYIQNNDIVNLKKYNAICKNNCILLTKLTNNLIDVSKINCEYLSMNLEMHNLIEVIEDNVMSLVDYAEWNDVKLVFDTDIEECNMMLDTEFMNRIIINLISNAVKFTPSGGRIDFFITKNNNNIEVSIEDTGIGMTEEFIGQAFDIYAVDKTNIVKKNGSGIGLFVVKEMVEKQGGTIKIEKNRMIGTKIVMAFKYDKSINYGI